MSKPKKKFSPVSHSQRSAAQQYRLLSDLMNSIPDVVYIKDRKGRFLYVNQAHAKGLELSPDQLVGKTDFDLFPRKRALVMAKDDEYVMKKGKSIIDKVERATRTDGEDNFVSTTKVPHYDENGKIIGLMGITRDITKRVRLEQEREQKILSYRKGEMNKSLNRLKASIISTVSHELRTPVAIIQQLMGVMLNETAGTVNDKQRGILLRTRTNVGRLKNLIDKLLDVAQIENKGLKLNYSLVNVCELLRDSEDFFKNSAREKNISLSYHLTPQDVNIFVDPERIVEVINNLMENALKFTEEQGKIAVDLAVLETKVRIAVSDTGVGIAPGDLAKIFGRFVQAGDNEKLLQKGLGLGLSIVQEIVAKHGGEIWAESQPGVGSKFYFTLPRYHTTDVLKDPVKDKINYLLHKNHIVHLVNFLVLNYKEFHRYNRVDSLRIFTDLENVIDQVFKEVFRKTALKEKIVIRDAKYGKYSILFSKVSRTATNTFCEKLVSATRKYLNQHKKKDVFIAVGLGNYSSPGPKEGGLRTPSNIDFREIYIGSEMRRFERVDYTAFIKVTMNDGQSFQCRGIDLSLGGLCFFSDKHLKADTKLKVNFELFYGKTAMTIPSRVAWIQEVKSASGEEVLYHKIGVEFTEMTTEDKKKLMKELDSYHEKEKNTSRR